MKILNPKWKAYLENEKRIQSFFNEEQGKWFYWHVDSAKPVSEKGQHVVWLTFNTCSELCRYLGERHGWVEYCWKKWLRRIVKAEVNKSVLGHLWNYLWLFLQWGVASHKCACLLRSCTVLPHSSLHAECQPQWLIHLISYSDSDCLLKPTTRRNLAWFKSHFE